MASTASVLSQLFSWLALLLIIALLTPQAYLNYQHQSTEGQSTAMMYVFLMSAIIPAAFFIYEAEPIALTLSWFGFGIVSIFILCQVVYYRPATATTTAAATLQVEAAGGGSSEQQRSLKQRRKRFVYQFVAYSLVSALLIGLFYVIFFFSGPSASASWLPNAVGYILPSGLTILGYLLQMRLIVATKDASGISPGFIVLDLMGCTCSIISIALDQWDGAAAAPFFAITACQLVMATLHYLIYPVSKTHKSQQGEEQHNDSTVAGNNSLEQEKEEVEEEHTDSDAVKSTSEDEKLKLESGINVSDQEEQSDAGVGHVQLLGTSLHSSDEENREDESENVSTSGAHGGRRQWKPREDRDQTVV